MQAAAAAVPALAGGAADREPSPTTRIADSPSVLPGSFGGRNLHFGIREHAMGAVMNGMAVHGGLIPFGATFLAFADYLRPSIRLAALMGLHLVYVFTHDSIAVGEDGPTHQPVEQLASLRAIPGLVVIRPADANETAAAWQTALELNDRPAALILSRQNLPTLDRGLFAPAEGLARGAYILAGSPDSAPDLILMASGSEVHLAVTAREKLQEKGLSVRVVSMPSWELFDAQPASYRDQVLPPAVTARLAVEAGITQGWHRYVGGGGDVIGMDSFGAAAPGPTVTAAFGFTVENVCNRSLELLQRT
jgi:transketolase